MAAKKMSNPFTKSNAKTALSVVAGFGIVAGIGAFFGNNKFVKKFFAGLRGEPAAASEPTSDGKWWTIGK